MSEQVSRYRVTDRVTIVPRGKKKIYTAEFWHEGQHRRKSLKTSNRKVAEQVARQLDAQLAGGEYAAVPEQYGFKQAVEEFIDAKRAEGARRKTIVKYCSELNTLAAFLARHHVSTLNRVTARLHDRYRNERSERLQPYTVYNHAIIHKEFFNWCVSRQLLLKNPLEQVKLAKPKRIPGIAATLEQVDALLRHAPSDLAAQLATLAFTGLRSGELQNLRMEDVDLEQGWIHVRSRTDWASKTGPSRKVPIHPRLLTYLQTQPRRRRGAWFFCAAPSRRYPSGDHHLNPRHLNERFQRLARRLGMPVGRKQQGLVIHALRHFFETFTLNAGVPQRAVDIWMGHTGSRSMSAIYYHLTDEQSQAFMARVPFDPPPTLKQQDDEAA